MHDRIDRRLLMLAIAVAAAACSADGLAEDDSTASVDGWVATETGFECTPTCARLLCGSGSNAIYAALLVGEEAEIPRADLQRHLGGVEVDDPLYDIIVPSAGAQTQGVVSFETTGGADYVSAWFLASESEADGDSYAVCDWTPGREPVLFGFDELEALNASGDCQTEVTERARPIVCDDDHPGDG